MTLGISIHAPCTGSDPKTSGKGERLGISIHAPCTGSDGISPHCINSASTFQSTLPARGATLCSRFLIHSQPISIHAPCTGSDFAGTNTCKRPLISIHAPCTGSDGIAPTFGQAPFISIHAPCTGSDLTTWCSQIFIVNFNPRSLHGERRYAPDS